MKAVLINHTPLPLKTIYYAHLVQKQAVPDSLEEMNVTVEELESFYKDMQRESLNTPMEYVLTSWKLEAVSRSLQQQLTRSRIGFSYSIQSMRVVNKANFFDKNEYHTPKKIADHKNEDVPMEYHLIMNEIQDSYRTLLELTSHDPAYTEDIRGILPLNIHSTITFSANLNSLINMMNKRMCVKVQGEFRDLVLLMVEEIRVKMGGVIADSIDLPCYLNHKCIMVKENEDQLIGKDKRVPCSIYVKNFNDGIWKD